ncbi:MAG: imidazole glycerol phosphate synthase cyclase subunit [Defluviitaleaceae bacterium]|nr:imidazole glycerol phosphate synthase cyclase subunit [Defluviitaleaceae bacterium]
MNRKKLITCLDVRDGILTKGVKFLGNQDIGDPVEIAKKYCQDGIDEVVLYDFTATHEGRGTRLGTVEKVAKVVTVPFGVGGGIKSLEDCKAVMAAGAQKVHINSAAAQNPELLAQAVQAFGANAIVLSMDVLAVEKSAAIPTGFEVVINGGRTRMNMDAAAWARQGVALGACEIVVNSIDADGTKDGFDIGATRAVAQAVNVPVVASGGGGTIQHIYDVLTEGCATVALVASMLHFGEYTVPQIKDGLAQMGLEL